MQYLCTFSDNICTKARSRIKICHHPSCSRKSTIEKSFFIIKDNTSSVSLWLTPSPTGEGWRKSLLLSAHSPYPRPPCTFSGRADNACTNLLGYLVRYVRTRGIVEIVESDKTAHFCFVPYRTHSPRMTRATNSCTRRVFFKRGELTNARSALVGVAETGGKSPLK